MTTVPVLAQDNECLKAETTQFEKQEAKALRAIADQIGLTAVS